MYGKICPGFGCHQVWNQIYHKDSIGKLLSIRALVIIPNNNDLCQGGTARKLSIARCSGDVEEDKDIVSYVYKDDGTHHYPKIPDTWLQVKGREYLKTGRSMAANPQTRREREVCTDNVAR